jgi:hypothetical protein
MANFWGFISGIQKLKVVSLVNRNRAKNKNVGRAPRPSNENGNVISKMGAGHVRVLPLDASIFQSVHAERHSTYIESSEGTAKLNTGAKRNR